MLFQLGDIGLDLDGLGELDFGIGQLPPQTEPTKDRGSKESDSMPRLQ